MKVRIFVKVLMVSAIALFFSTASANAELGYDPNQGAKTRALGRIKTLFRRANEASSAPGVSPRTRSLIRSRAAEVEKLPTAHTAEAIHSGLRAAGLQLKYSWDLFEEVAATNQAYSMPGHHLSYYQDYKNFRS